MKFHVQIAVAIVGACLAGGVMAADDPIEMVATVEDIDASLAAACASADRHDGDHDDDHDDFWNLKKDSEFDFQRVASHRYNIHPVSSGIDESIKEPVFLRINVDNPWLDLSPCKSAGLKDKQFLVALHEMQEPQDAATKSWHALIYVPVKKSGNNHFYLFVESIVNDATKCEALSGQEKAACKALRTLAVMKMDGRPLKEIHDKTNETIDTILEGSSSASSPSAAEATSFFYHNGVIHGSLF